MILVTGGTGFIGSHLLDKLSALGEPARCLLRRKPRPRRLPAGIEAAYGDLTSGEGVEEAVSGAQTVIHRKRSPRSSATCTFTPFRCRRRPSSPTTNAMPLDVLDPPDVSAVVEPDASAQNASEDAANAMTDVRLGADRCRCSC